MPLHYDVIEFSFFFVFILGVYLLGRLTEILFFLPVTYVIKLCIQLKFFLQVVIASKAWTLPLSALIGLITIPCLVSCLTPGLILLRKRTSTKLKRILCGIGEDRFLLRYLFLLPWSPFIYFILDQQLRFPASMVLVHAALKWLHSFTPDDGSIL